MNCIHGVQGQEGICDECKRESMEGKMITPVVFINVEGLEEMLKISPDGFYVRGKKLPQDENEARAVYDAFILWLQKTNN